MDFDKLGRTAQPITPEQVETSAEAQPISPQQIETSTVAQPISSDQLEISTEVPSLPELSSGGNIISTPDNVESAQGNFAPLALGAEEPIASNFVAMGSGAVDWNAITELKTEMGKSKPDASVLMQILHKLSPNDLAATLQELAKEGTPSELQLMMDKIIANPTALQQMGPVLASFAGDKSLNTQQPNAMDQILSEMIKQPGWDTSGFDGVVRNMIQLTQHRGILPSLSQNTINKMHEILEYSKPQRTLNALYSSALTNETGVYGLATNLNFLMQLAMQGDGDTSVAEAIREFPDSGLNALNQIISDPSVDSSGRSTLERFRTYLAATGQDEAGMLASLCKNEGSKAEPVLNAFLRSMQQNPQGEFVLGSGETHSPAADAEIRKMIQDLGGNAAVQTLSNFSMDCLTNIKALLLAGSNQPLDQDAINNVIDPAINNAEWRNRMESGLQASQNIKFEF